MSEFKGAPGPWRVIDNYAKYEDGPFVYIWNGDEQASKSICDMGEMGDFNYSEEIANANLIATAPELLEALQALMNSYNKWDNLLHFNVDVARQAINKALGKETEI